MEGFEIEKQKSLLEKFLSAITKIVFLTKIVSLKNEVEFDVMKILGMWTGYEIEGQDIIECKEGLRFTKENKEVLTIFSKSTLEEDPKYLEDPKSLFPVTKIFLNNNNNNANAIKFILEKSVGMDLQNLDERNRKALSELCDSFSPSPRSTMRPEVLSAIDRVRKMHGIKTK